MRTFLSYIFTAIIGAAVAFCFFGRKEHNPKELKVLHTDTVVIHRVDTVVKSHYIPKYVCIPQTDTIKQIDTVFVVKDYFAARFYADTLKDSSTVVYLQDSVRENRIVSRTWSCITTQPTKIVTKTVQKPIKKLGVGLSVIYSDKKVCPGINLSWRNFNHGFSLTASQNCAALGWAWFFNVP